jgi:hypothetical protein
MKKLFYSSIFLFSSIFFISCEEEDKVFNVDGNESAYFFPSTNVNFPVSPESNNLNLNIGVTTRSTSVRNFNLEVNPESTATPDMYNIDLNSLTIEPGAFNGQINITSDLQNLPEEGNVTLILDLIPSDGYNMPDKGQVTISLFRSCPTSLAGQYSVTTEYGFHDFLPEFSIHTMEVTIFNNTSANTYYVNDFSGGLYSVGPYCPAYNTCNAAQNRLNFEVNCGAVQWTGQVEPFGALEMLDGGINTYDSSTGVVTISWFCPAYGEFGTSVYTPL